MPYIVIGIVLYMLWRHYAQKGAAAPAAGDQGLPAAGGGPGQPVYGGGGPGDQGPPSAGGGSPAPAAPTWQELGPTDAIPPGFTYRASAPDPGMMVTMMIPSALSSHGFTDVTIYKPGEAFPNDWPDSGTAMRVQATLPASAQPASMTDLSGVLSGVRVWQFVQPAAATAGVAKVASQVGGQVEQVMTGLAQRLAQHPHPKNFGVYSGLVRRPDSDVE